MRFQIRNANAVLAFYEAETAKEALDAFREDMLRGMEKVLEGADAVIHTENGRPAFNARAGVPRGVETAAR
jgi:hypothetical protein